MEPVLSKVQLELADWLTQQLRFINVPRLVDVVTFVKKNGLELSKKQVSQVLRLHPMYKQNMPQQRNPGRSKTYRPVVVSELGHWHADIGFFSINSRYETPKSFRSGYLVAKDVLSRQIFATPLIKTKTAESLITAFKKLFALYAAQNPDGRVLSVAFDRETSVMSKKVQRFFKENNITFHAFKMSSSKAKFAEGAIRQIREKMARLMERGNVKDRWWNLLPAVVDTLNNQEIVIDKKPLGFKPNQITGQNVGLFIKKLHKAVPAYYFAQFDIAPQLVPFKFTRGTLVRAKLISTSSDVLGNKRSESNLTQQVFVIENSVPYVTRKMSIGKAYKCRNMFDKKHVEIFQEDEITPTTLKGDDEKWKSQPTWESTEQV